MAKKTKTVTSSRADGVLSPEELEKAIAEYKAKYHANEPEMKDSEEETPVVEEEVAETAEVVPAKEETAEVPEEVEPVELAEEEKPEAADEEAEVDVNQQTKDIQTLLDIIDTLMAERDFEKSAEVATDSVDDEEEELNLEDFEDLNEDEDDGAFMAGELEEEVTPAENEDDADSDIPDATKADVPLENDLNMDSVDKIVRDRIQVGMMGKTLNLDGLEYMKLRDARKAVVKAVLPTMNLDGKSDAFIDAAYEMACDEVKTRESKGVSYQKQQMFNADAAQPTENAQSANSARERMINRMHNREEN